MSRSAGLRALAVAFPEMVRTNDYWRRRQPELVARSEAETVGRVWSPPAGEPLDAFTAEMQPFMSDPFRGGKERRVLAPGERTLDLEAKVARQALDAAGLEPKDVELMLVSSLMPDTLAVGNAAYLARELGIGGAAWNLESACSSALIGLQTATAYVKSGEYRNVLVVASCAYSRDIDESDALSWTVGDGAAAMVVGEAPAGEGVLAFKTVHTAQSCGAMFHELTRDAAGEPAIRMRAGKGAGRLIRETALRVIDECCRGAVEKAGVKLEDVAFLAVTTPVAWYSRFASRALGFDASQTIDTYPSYNNTGPVLVPTNLHHAAHAGKFKKGDLVLLHSVGSVATACAAVIRWGDVALGPMPGPGLREPLEAA